MLFRFVFDFFRIYQICPSVNQCLLESCFAIPGLEGEPETMMKVTLSYDARIVEEDKAFQFLEAFRDALENPMAMI